MNSLAVMWQVILADFRERTRRYSYLITLMVALFLGYLVLTGKYSYLFGPFKPEYNSHWVGTTVALAGAAMFTLMGFFVVRTSISRDRDTRVGEILAATRLSNLSYLLAKFVSNVLVLWSMVAALALTAFAGMLANVPLDRIDLLAFTLPFILLPLFATVTVAGAAVLFDTVRWLRGAVGNILYFFLAEFLIISGLFKIPYIDAAGLGLLESSVKGAIAKVYPGEAIPMTIGFVGLADDVATVVATKLFVWEGIDWTLTLVLSRFIWPALALLLLILAVLFFDRFEQSRKTFKPKKASSKKRMRLASVSPQPAFDRSLTYQSLPAVTLSRSVVPLIFAELKLGLKQLKPVWLLIGLVVLAGELSAPFAIARKYIVPAAMIWPLVLWSSIGTRETLFNMRSLLFSSAGVHGRQFASQLLCGIVIGAAMCLPMFVRATLAGEYSYLILLAASVLFLPTVAFALGVVSGSRKLFEVLYPMIWYGGSIDHISAIDLLGTTSESTGSARVALFVVMAVGSAIVAYVARRRSALV